MLVIGLIYDFNQKLTSYCFMKKKIQRKNK